MRRQHKVWRFMLPLSVFLAAVLLSMILAGCSSSTTAVAEPVNLAARVYVDRDGDGIWSEGDVALPEIVILLDGEQLASTDEQGWVCFEAISATQHTVTLDAEDISELSSHSLVCQTTERTIEVSGNREISFCFAARNFLELDVQGENEGK